MASVINTFRKITALGKNLAAVVPEAAVGHGNLRGISIEEFSHGAQSSI
jgi:hypothetical protein